MILVLFISFLFSPQSNSLAAGYASIATTQYSPAQANSIINSTLAYVNTINQSAYLIFAPNLKQAYIYLSDAEHLYNTSPVTAVAYADLARTYAQNEYNEMSSYSSVSLIVTAVLAAVFLLLLYKYMKPIVKGSTKGTKRKKK